MRKLFLVLPFAGVLLAAGVLFGGLGRSLANTELPGTEPATPRAAAAASPESAKEDWTETARKVKQPKSNFQKPDEPYPPGSRRPIPPGSKRRP